jgi:hypothetical protein
MPPDLLEVPQSSMALDCFLARAKQEELQIVYRALAHLLASRTLAPSQVPVALSMHQSLEREFHHRLRAAALPLGDEAELPF